LGDWVETGGDGGGWLVVADLIFIRMLIFLMAGFGCVTKKSSACQFCNMKNGSYLQLAEIMGYH
jgi:hypothetical protein